MSRLEEIKNRIELWKIEPQRAQIITFNDIFFLINRVARLEVSLEQITELTGADGYQMQDIARAALSEEGE